MEPSVKIMEYIMLVIIIIMALNYAEYIGLDPKLVILFSIACTWRTSVEPINPRLRVSVVRRLLSTRTRSRT